MELFKQINADYVYLENITEGQRKLLKQFESDSWKLIRIKEFGSKKGVCEICGNTNIKKVYQIQNLTNFNEIEVGIGCYRKILKETNFQNKNITGLDEKKIISNQNEIEKRRKNLEILFKEFVEKELPIIKEKALTFNISFDDTLTKIQVREWWELKLAVAKIRALKKLIEEHEFQIRLKQIYKKKSELTTLSVKPIHENKNNSKAKNQIIKNGKSTLQPKTKRPKKEQSLEKIARKKRREVIDPAKVKYETVPVSNSSIGEAWRKYESNKKKERENVRNKTYKQKCEDMVKRLLAEGKTNKLIHREVKRKLGLKSTEISKLIKRFS